MFDNEIRNLYSGVQRELKTKSESSIANINEEIVSIRNNIVSRLNDMINGYGFNIKDSILEGIVDSTLTIELRQISGQTLEKNYQTLHKFNSAINSTIMEQAQKQESKSTKEEQINTVIEKFDYTMSEYKKSKINLLEQYNHLFQSILKEFPLYDSPELVENIKTFLTTEKESIELYFQEQRNIVITSNFAELVAEQQFLVKKTDLVSNFKNNNEKKLENVEKEIKESKNVEEKEVSKSTIKLSECDLNEGYYHFTNSKNVESILNNGLEARIGTASKMVNDRPNVSISQGGKGVFGIVNSFIFVLSKKKKSEIPENFRKYFDDINDFSSDEIVSRESVCKAITNKLKDENYIYINIDKTFLLNARIGGLSGFDINLPNDIDSSKLSLITDDNDNILSSYDIVSYMYEKVKNNNVWREFNEDLFYMMELNQLSKENVEFNNSNILQTTEESIGNDKKKLSSSSLKSDEHKITNSMEQSNQNYIILDDGTIEWIGKENKPQMSDEDRQVLSKMEQQSSKVSNDELLVSIIKKNINDNLWNDIGIMASNTDNTIDIISNQTMLVTESVLAKYGIQNSEEFIKKVVDEMNFELKEINNNLSTNMIKSFTKINEETVNSISQTFNRPDEIKSQDVEQCMKVYKNSTSLASFRLSCDKQFEQCMSKICYQYKINNLSNAYNEMVRIIESRRMQMESQFYNMYTSFSNNNSMFIDKAVSSAIMTQDIMKEMQQDFNDNQILQLISYNYQEYEKNNNKMNSEQNLQQISGISR